MEFDFNPANPAGLLDAENALPSNADPAPANPNTLGSISFLRKESVDKPALWPPKFGNICAASQSGVVRVRRMQRIVFFNFSKKAKGYYVNVNCPTFFHSGVLNS